MGKRKRIGWRGTVGGIFGLGAVVCFVLGQRHARPAYFAAAAVFGTISALSYRYLPGPDRDEE